MSQARHEDPTNLRANSELGIDSHTCSWQIMHSILLKTGNWLLLDGISIIVRVSTCSSSDQRGKKIIGSSDRFLSRSLRVKNLQLCISGWIHKFESQQKYTWRCTSDFQNSDNQFYALIKSDLHSSHWLHLLISVGFSQVLCNGMWVLYDRETGGEKIPLTPTVFRPQQKLFSSVI